MLYSTNYAQGCYHYIMRYVTRDWFWTQPLRQLIIMYKYAITLCNFLTAGQIKVFYSKYPTYFSTEMYQLYQHDIVPFLPFAADLIVNNAFGGNRNAFFFFIHCRF